MPTHASLPFGGSLILKRTGSPGTDSIISIDSSKSSLAAALDLEIFTINKITIPLRGMHLPY